MKLYFVPVCSDVNKLVSSAEVKVTGFLAEQNFSFADHLGPLFRNIVPDSKNTKAYVYGKPKASYILNRTVAPDLQETLVNQKPSVFVAMPPTAPMMKGLKK